MPLASMPAYKDIAEFIPRFRQMAAEAGRDPASVPVQVNNVADDAAKLARYRELEVIRVVVSLPSDKADKILPILDRWVPLMRAARG
jgi:alkanesulfonate monooxygenase SsuD/methylene tetrahydromethanopterin reductase-like flavin-dependent oxidoreductase (luciferase family)